MWIQRVLMVLAGVASVAGAHEFKMCQGVVDHMGVSAVEVSGGWIICGWEMACRS